MADEKVKVSVDSKILPVLHRELKDDIKKKAKEKDWNETEKEDFISSLLKLYKETVELALRENVVVSHEQTPTSTCSSKVKQEMETVDKERAKDVNDMCAKSDELLQCTIKKRKIYPQKITKCLCMKHDAEMIDLQKLEDKISKEKPGAGITDGEAQLDLTECENVWPRLKPACDDHTRFSKSLSEAREKLQRFNTVAKMKLKMQDNELHRTLFGKRKLPSSFDSLLVTPTKELKLDKTITESDNTLSMRWNFQENEQLKTLESCVRKSSPDRP